MWPLSKAMDPIAPIKEHRMKSLMWLLSGILTDVKIRCGTDTHRDYLTISRRIKHEGLSFLTITLPMFSQGFERSLEVGLVDPSFFKGFRSSKKGPLPAFLQGLVGQVFDPADGRILSNPSSDAVFSVRQVCRMWNKVLVKCDDSRTNQALDKFVVVDNEIESIFQKIPKDDWEDFSFLSDVMWSKVLSPLSVKIDKMELIPRHGPGATSERIYNNQKYIHKTWHQRLQDVYFPFDWYGCHNPTGLLESEIEDVVFVEPGDELPVRVTPVPKTLKSPRIIAIEPVCNQYIQQAILQPLVECLESSFPVAGHINFSDQGINRHYAKEGSKVDSYATIDLSDASDRVHQELVFRMLSSVPTVRDAIFACRSRVASLPDGRTVHLNKFASMGSALCFPIESMVFFTLCILARLKGLGLRPNASTVASAAAGVYIYGDDIIVPTGEVPAVIRYLELFGLKVNAHKTFYTGRFRESCGLDAYAGENVTPVYVRHLPPSDRHDSSAVVSYVSLANQLYEAGWWVTAQRVRDKVESLLGIQLPLVRDTAPCLGWINSRGAYSFQRLDTHTHNPIYKGYVVSAKKSDDPLTGYPALMKCFLMGGHKPSFDEHLERSVRPGSANINFRWARTV